MLRYSYEHENKQEGIAHCLLLDCLPGEQVTCDVNYYVTMCWLHNVLHLRTSSPPKYHVITIRVHSMWASNHTDDNQQSRVGGALEENFSTGLARAQGTVCAYTPQRTIEVCVNKALPGRLDAMKGKVVFDENIKGSQHSLHNIKQKQTNVERAKHTWGEPWWSMW